MRTLHKYILDASISAISNQNANGSFSPGVNGPYNDKETPVRNTAHWLFLLLKSYEITGDIKFKNSSVKALEYLMTAECRPGGYAMFCRDVKNKDQCNGLTGQAWAIESILKGGLILDRQDAVTFAIDIFNSHYFDESRSIWHRLSLDGQIMTRIQLSITSYGLQQLAHFFQIKSQIGEHFVFLKILLHALSYTQMASFNIIHKWVIFQRI